MQQNDSLADGQLPRYRSLCRDLCALSLSGPTLVPPPIASWLWEGAQQRGAAEPRHLCLCPPSPPLTAPRPALTSPHPPPIPHPPARIVCVVMVGGSGGSRTKASPMARGGCLH